MKKKFIVIALIILSLTCIVLGLSSCNNVQDNQDKSTDEQIQGDSNSSNDTEDSNNNNTEESKNEDNSDESSSDNNGSTNNPPDDIAVDGVLKFKLNEDRMSYTVYIFDCFVVDTPEIDSIEDFYAKYPTELSIVTLEIPSSYNGLPVTAIGDYAFTCLNIESVTIPDTVTHIGRYAFGNCSNLSGVVLSKELTTIDDYAFYHCAKLMSIELPATLTKLGDNESPSVFYGCRKLIEIINHSNLNVAEMLRPTSHSNSKALEVHGGESKLVKNGDYIFYTASGKNWMMAYTGNETDLTLPGSYNGKNYYIHSYAFIEHKDTVLSITMQNDQNASIAISSNAFYGCEKLQSISISNNVLSLSANAFDGCSSLSSITVDNGNESYSSNGNCLVWKDKKILLKGFDNSVIPNDGSVESIYHNAFNGCKSITEIVIPASVTTIGRRAFYDCVALQRVIVPSTIQNIGEEAFTNTNITYNKYNTANYLGNEVNPYVVLVSPENLEITSCEIHKDTQIIIRGAFEGCKKISSLTLPFIGASCVQDEDYDYGYLAYIFGAYDYYDSQEYVPETLKSITLIGVTNIGSFAFYDCSSIENFNMPTTVEKIGSYAFGNCTGIKNIVVPDSVETIGNNAFSGCTSLESITVPFVGWSAASYSDEKFSYIFDSSGDTVPSSVKNVIITGGTKIARFAFCSCENLENITIANSILEIGSYAFEDCTQLKSVVFEEPSGWACYFIDKESDLQEKRNRQ